MHAAAMLAGAEIFAASVSIPADQHPFGHAFTEPEIYAE
jgi:hypothetical protein